MLRLAAALWWFWYRRGLLAEGRDWLEEALAGPHDDAGGSQGTPLHPLASPAAVQAEALCGSGALAFRQADYAAAVGRLGASLALWRELGDAGRRGAGYALIFLGLAALFHGDGVASAARLAEAVAHFRNAGDRWGLAYALNPLGKATLLLGNADTARTYMEEALTLFRHMRDSWGVSLTLANIAEVLLYWGDLPAARRSLEEALCQLEQVGDSWLCQQAECMLGTIAQRQGDAPRAAEHWMAGLALSRTLGSTPWLATCLVGLAAIAVAHGHAQHAARLLGAAEGVRDATGFRPPLTAEGEATSAVQVTTQVTAAACAALGEEALAATRAEGRALAATEAVDYALAAAGSLLPSALEGPRPTSEPDSTGAGVAPFPGAIPESPWPAERRSGGAYQSATLPSFS
jgi:tetratricopeptide (TPR) repeat protein